eukprot:TRINITY_DN4813_c0_g5_i3.p1 TRINITY_DN4813_c0_g5~~TRINITY_DN4813_c0_g5_i3.p1  ORF type:complete len:448 (-),score=200.09 TRINITY_DN4813_c0_g5_i3:226-1500(-)
MSFDPVSVAKDFASAYYEQLMGANWRGLAEWYLPEAIYSRTDEETGVATPISTVNSIVAELEKTHRKHPNCIAELSVVTAQEIAPQGNLLVQVVGAFEDQKAQTKHRFSHTFVLLKEVDDAHEISFYIQNEVLVYLSGSKQSTGGRGRNQKAAAQKAEAATPAAPVAAANGAAASAPVTPAAEAAPAKAAEPAKAPAAKEQPAAAAAAAPKEKKQQQQKPKNAGKAKDEKPAAQPAAQPAAPKPTTWASIAKTDAPAAGSFTSSAPAPAPAAVKPKTAAATPAAKPAAEAAKPAAAAAPAKSEKLALFVGNLTPAVDEQALRKAFGAFGKVTKVDVIPRKNIGFVEFDAPVASFAELSKKFEANPVVLDGKTLRVDLRDGAPKSAGKPAGKATGGKPQQRLAKDKVPADDFDQEEIPSGSLLAE